LSIDLIVRTTEIIDRDILKKLKTITFCWMHTLMVKWIAAP